MLPPLWAVLMIFFLKNFAFAKILTSTLSLSTTYDFVIVGGGTAGNVLANRLTEDPGIRVLVIESGGSNEDVLELQVPFLMPEIPAKYTWNFTTTPQIGLAGRSIGYTRGHVLGGSSSINGMVYTRGSADDYDMIASLTEDDGWSWDRLQSYIRKHERWSSPVNSSLKFFDPDVHGFHGMTAVSLSKTQHSLDDRMLKATEEGTEFSFNADYNSGKPLGFGWAQSTITSRGRRDSSATSYLSPKFRRRANLHVLLNHRVLRLLPAAHEPNPHFNAVEYGEIVNGTIRSRRVVKASKEIILSAGSVGTPHVLLHSGIGDRKALSALGIKTAHHLPSVGQNFTEQPIGGLQWLVNDNNTTDRFTQNATLMAELLDEWKLEGSGPLTSATTTHIGFLRLPNDSAVFDTASDPSAGVNTPHIELSFSNGFIVPVPAGSGLGVLFFVVTPLSRGSISLNTSDPLDQPLIDPALLVDEFDRFTLREAVRLAFRFVGTPAWKDYVLEPFGLPPDLNISNDAQLDAYLRDNAIAGLHSVGSASMSPKGAHWGVTDPDLKVKGVRGVRVVDASVIPHMPSAHTQTPVYIIAERAADLIKESWGIL
ncbi:GMC oxidoreductase family protein [Pleurotus pulmonarius]